MSLNEIPLLLHADIKKSVPRHDDKGRISFRVTTLISEEIASFRHSPTYHHTRFL